MEERIDQHVYKFVEAELRNYKINKILVAEYDKELEYAGARSTLSIASSCGVTQKQISDPTHLEVVRIVANENRIKRARNYVKCIDDVLDELSSQDKKLVELRYFQDWLTDWAIYRELHIGKSKYYEDKHRIIRKIAFRMRLI